WLVPYEGLFKSGSPACIRDGFEAGGEADESGFVPEAGHEGDAYREVAHEARRDGDDGVAGARGCRWGDAHVLVAGGEVDRPGEGTTGGDNRVEVITVEGAVEPGAGTGVARFQCLPVG